MKTVIDEDLSPAEAGELGEKLDAFNAEKSGFDDEKPLRLAARDEEGRLQGGLSGVTGMKWLYIHILWVEPEYRDQGVGRKLVLEAERLGRERNCRSACLMTFSFQAHEFYTRLGYLEYGRLEDYPDGHTLYFLKKILP